jgi:hypothetical protein
MKSENEIKEKLKETIEIFSNTLQNKSKKDFVKWFNKAYIYTYDANRKTFKIMKLSDFIKLRAGLSWNDSAGYFLLHDDNTITYHLLNKKIHLDGKDYEIMKKVFDLKKEGK